MLDGCQLVGTSGMGRQEVATAIEIRNILLATDFGATTETALHYSLAIARRYGAKIYLVHVVRPDLIQFGGGDNRAALDGAWREAQRHMTDLLIAGHLQGVEHQVVVEQGDVWSVLAAKIEELRIDLLVVGTHGRSRIGKLLLGSVAEQIFRQATCPVLMVGPETPLPEGKGVQKILFCTGFSAHSLHAGLYALSMAERQNAELVMLHVSSATPATEEERDRLREELCGKLMTVVPASAKLKAPPQCIVEFGTAAERILSVADEQHPNVIVMGVRQPVGFARRIKWATAYEVVANAPCPVMTVRNPGTE